MARTWGTRPVVFSATTISKTVWTWLRQGSIEAGVLATFDQACDLITHDGRVVALVDPRRGNGPLNVVLRESTFPFRRPCEGMTVTLTKDTIRLGPLRVDLGPAVQWDPRPVWSELRARRGIALIRMPLLRDLCLELAPSGSLLALLEGAPPPESPLSETLAETRAALALRDRGGESDLWWLRELAARLTGLGPGLTPSGDDFLVGMMMWEWLSRPQPLARCRALASAADRTTALSSALLRVSAHGECSESWHLLLAQLCSTTEPDLAKPVQELLAYGATSGADALTGFLWAALNFDKD